MTNDPLVRSFVGLFDLSGLLAFLGGVLFTYVWMWLKDRYHDRTDPAHKPHRTAFRSMLLLWMLVYVVVGYIALQQQAQANAVHQLADQTESCQADFLRSLKDRSQASDDADNWSQIKTQAIAEWMHALTFPPQDMIERRVKNPNDPEYVRWALLTTEHYFEVIDNANQQQDSALNYRKSHPLPEPKCGKRS